LDDIAPAAPPDSEPPGPTPTLPFRRPADHYSSPVEARPLFARWVPYGCGTAALVVLIAIFAAGFAASSGGMGRLFDFMFGSIQGEVEKIFTKDVTAAEKTAFEDEMKRLRESLSNGRIRMDRVQPLLRSIREVSEDEKVTPQETERLIHELRDVNRSVKR